MHSQITKTALNDFPQLKSYAESLKFFSKQVDFDERGFFFNNHFFFSRKMLFSKQKSFLDFNGKNNALAKYNEHVNEMKLAFKAKNIDLGIEEAGRALHYLQDMTQPQHVQTGSIIQKIINAKNHLTFEQVASDNYRTITKKYKKKFIKNPIKKVEESYENIFFKTVNYTDKFGELPTKDQSKWNKIARKCVYKAINSSKSFLNKVAELIDEVA